MRVVAVTILFLQGNIMTEQTDNSELVRYLRQFNLWRCGEIEFLDPHPIPNDLTKAINRAISIIRKYDKLTAK